MRRPSSKRAVLVAAAAAALSAVIAVAVAATASRDDAPPRAAADTVLVARAVDGDTLELASGAIVRLVQVDAPELSEDECYAREARRVLAELVPPGTRVTLAPDPTLDLRAGRHGLDLDKVDRLGEPLAYVLARGRNVNVALAERGAVSPWFATGERGRHGATVLAAARRARAARRGLWASCPGTKLDPRAPVATGAARVSGYTEARPGL